MLDNHHYITPQDYDIAERNGINKKQVYARVYAHMWNIEKAITQPIRKQNKCNKEALEKAEKNGISNNVFYSRIRNGWDEEKACTVPIIDHSETWEKTTRVRKYSKDIVALAKKNGVPYPTLARRIRTGWSEHEAATTKPMTKQEASRSRIKKNINIRKKLNEQNKSL